MTYLIESGTARKIYFEHGVKLTTPAEWLKTKATTSCSIPKSYKASDAFSIISRMQTAPTAVGGLDKMKL
jgi:hypothetical protein